MKMKVLAFGIVKEIVAGSSITVDMPEGSTAAELKTALEDRYPRLQQLASCLMAVNNEYAEAGQIIVERDEIALIPPVSGG